MEGWIKIHRKILDNPIICKDSDYLSVWIYLLLNATHKEIPALFKGEKITLQPGQLITGRKSMSSKLKISESKIYRIINEYKSGQQIEQQTSNKNSLITIVNWNTYQESEQQTEQQVKSISLKNIQESEQQTEQLHSYVVNKQNIFINNKINNKRTTSEQQLNTNKNERNIYYINLLNKYKAKFKMCTKWIEKLNLQKQLKNDIEFQALSEIEQSRIFKELMM